VTVSNNAPSAGYIAWSGLHIQYAGIAYTIADGNTNKMYAYWTPSAPGSLISSDTFPALAASDCLVLLNRGGTATVVPTATVLPGDLIVPGTVKADKIDVTDLFANAAFLKKLQVGSAYAGDAPPASPAVGQMWRNTGATPNELLAWTGKGTSNARRYAASKSGAAVTIEDLSDSDDRALDVTVKTIAGQTVTEAGQNICPTTASLKWTLFGGAYRDSNGYIVLPDTGSNASIILYWGKASKALSAGVLCQSGNAGAGVHVSLAYYDANMSPLSPGGNGWANPLGTTADVWKHFEFWDDGSDYATSRGNGVFVELKIMRSVEYAAQPYRFRDPYFGVTASESPVAFVPQSPSPEYPAPISGNAAVSINVNGTQAALALQSMLYGLTGAEDERGTGGQEIHRTKLLTLTGAEDWSSDFSPDGSLYVVLGGLPSAAGWLSGTTCSHFPIRGEGLPRSYITGSDLSIFLVLPNSTVGNEFISDLASWKSWLAAQAAAGTPVQLLYNVATPTTITHAATPITGADGVNAITSTGASVTVEYTGSGWEAVGALQRLSVESVSITPEEGLRVDTVLQSADGAHQIPTYFSARGAKYGLFRSSDGAMILGGMVLPNGQPSGVAGAIVSPGSSGDSRIVVETASEGSGHARVDTAALHLVQPSFQGATDLNPAATGEKVPVWIEAVRSTVQNANSEYVDNYNAAVKALSSMRLVAMNESGNELSWLLLQRTSEGSTIYTDGAYDGSDKARTLANFTRCMRMRMPASESIVFSATARRYMLDWKTIEDDYQKYTTFKGGSASARDVGIVIQSSGFYRFVFHVDLDQASSSSGVMIHVNRMPSDWTPPTTRDYCTDADLTPSSGPARIAYRRAASAPLNATVTICELVADLYCSYGDKILPVVATAVASKTLVSEDTFFTAQRIG